MTFRDLAERYLEQHVRIPSRREGGRKLMEWTIGALRRIEIPGPGGVMPFERKLVEQISKADVEALRTAWRHHSPRAKGGEVGCNRLLMRLRHMFSWAIAEGYTDRTPFKRHGVPVIKLNSAAETPRHRRLEECEEERLIANANPRLQALIIAALETGMRLGELLSLQWRDIRWEEGVIILPPEKTKTNESRPIPMTQRLRAVLEMRRHDQPAKCSDPRRMCSATRWGSGRSRSGPRGQTADAELESKGCTFTTSGASSQVGCWNHRERRCTMSLNGSATRAW